MNDKTKSIIKHGVLLAVLLFLGVIVPQSLGLGTKSFNDSSVLSLYYFYTIASVVSALGIFFLYFSSTLKTDDEKYGNSVFFYSPGEFPGPTFKFLKKTSVIVFISIIIFSIIFGIFPNFFKSTEQRVFGADVLLLKEEFTQTENSTFLSLLLPISENLVLAFILALFTFTFRSYAKKKNISPVSFQLALFFFAILLYLFFSVINHQRYDNSDVSLLGVAMFWVTLAVITVVTSNFIPGVLMHILNNAFLDVREIFGANGTLILAIGLILFSIFSIFFIYNRRKEG